MKRYSRLLLLFFLTILLTFCQKDNCDLSSACKLAPEKGNCFALITKYYYDQEAGKCKEFSWGGCEGVVPFDTLEACEICECNN